MDADDGAWFAEIRGLPATPDSDPLALDEATAERLLTGRLFPDQAPPGYAEVAALLAATVAPSTAELAGQEAALAELQAVVRTHRASTWEADTPGRRRRIGLVVAIAAAGLSTGGIAAAATGNLPDPIHDAARSIFASEGDATPIPPIKPDRQPDPSVGTAGASGATTDGQGSRSAGEPGTTAMGAVEDDRCRASKAGKGAGEKVAAATSQAPVEATGGTDMTATHCQRSKPGGTGTSGQGKQAKTGSKGHGQGSEPPPSTASKQAGKRAAGHL
jgi:hypothetical protein